MTQYHIFTAADAVAYARQFGGVADPSSLTEAREIGDGNLNLVFKIIDTTGISRVIVKQALPYVRCVGESWPLTLDRARIEAETLTEHYQHCPQHTVRILHYDAELAVMVMEDLSDYQIWRSELVRGKHYPQAASQLGEYLAQTLFHTSDFYLHPHHKKAEVSRFTNPEMCEITEDLFFNDPYEIHPRNQYPAELEPEVSALRHDQTLIAAVAALKHRFLSHAEALLHGDIHSGSVFVADHGLKAIDAEFGYFGPMGFDPGTAMGNLLLNYCGLPGLLAPRDAADRRELRLQDVRQLWLGFAGRFRQLVAEKGRDKALIRPGYVDLFLQKVWSDAIGYSGTELIRRTVGMAHVADMEKIEDPDMQHDCLRRAMRLGKALILAAPNIDDMDTLTGLIRRSD